MKKIITTSMVALCLTLGSLPQNTYAADDYTRHSDGSHSEYGSSELYNCLFTLKLMNGGDNVRAQPIVILGKSAEQLRERAKELILENKNDCINDISWEEGDNRTIDCAIDAGEVELMLLMITKDPTLLNKQVFVGGGLWAKRPGTDEAFALYRYLRAAYYPEEVKNDKEVKTKKSNNDIRLQLEQSEKQLSAAADTIVAQAQSALDKAAVNTQDVLNTQLATLEARLSVLSLNRLVGVNVPQTPQMLESQRALAIQIKSNLEAQIALQQSLHKNGSISAEEPLFTELKLNLFLLDHHELMGLDKGALENKVYELMGELSVIKEAKLKSGV